ncbi:MAG: hypothetical protein ACR2OV_01875 [Hyphomicrobiaceae bacterium]
MTKNFLSTVTASSVLVLTTLLSSPVSGAQKTQCFIGRDHTGGVAQMKLVNERYGKYNEVFGVIRSRALGTMRIKANGWSGDGRIFRGHEHEGGARFIRIEGYNGRSLRLRVDGFRRIFPFQSKPC